jgi:Ser/Thr protein kinase RdoA (MazF antagonist)
MAGEYPPEVIADLDAMVRQGLHRWGMPSDSIITLLNVSENATFAARDPSTGRHLVLRLHRLGYSSIEEIRSELAWIEALRRDEVIETAAPVPAHDGGQVQTLDSPAGHPSRQAVAFAHLPGKEPDAANAIKWFQRLGEVTARMHLHARSWSRPAGFHRKRWDLASMVGSQAYWGPWRDAIGLEPQGAAVLEETLDLIRWRMEQFGTAPERFGLVHADLRLANLLVDGTRLRIIDFDDCGFSWYLYDFATAVSFIEHQPIVPGLLQAWCRGYRASAPLSTDEAAEMPTFVVLRRILLCAWLASHSEVPFARQVGAAYTSGTVEIARQLLQGRFLTLPA